MRRLLFYLYKILAFCSRMLSYKLYDRLIVYAHKVVGCVFPSSPPEYIDYDAHLDASGGLTICDGVVISTKVIILTHDWSFLKKQLRTSLSDAYRPVYIGSNSFIGAGAIILPGTTIGKSCIIGAGAVVKGTIEDYAIVVGNPARKIGDTRDEKNKLALVDSNEVTG